MADARHVSDFCDDMHDSGVVLAYLVGYAACGQDGTLGRRLEGIFPSVDLVLPS